MVPRYDGLKGPKSVQYFGPIVAALKELGGSARPTESGVVAARAQTHLAPTRPRHAILNTVSAYWPPF